MFKKIIKAALKIAAVSTGISFLTGSFVKGMFVKKFFTYTALLGLNAITAKGTNNTSGKNLGLKAATTNPVAPRNVVYGKTRVGGTIVHRAVSGANNNKLHNVIAIAAHEINAIKKLYIDGGKGVVELDFSSDFATATENGATVYRVTNSAFTNTDNDASYTGGSLIKLVVEKGEQTTSNGYAVAQMAEWTTDHKLQGIAYVYINCIFDTEKFASYPSFSFEVEGKKVYDPVTLTTAYSTNPSLIIRDYLMDATYGFGATSDEINDAATGAGFVKARSDCNDDVTITSGTEDRYTLNGQFEMSEEPQQVLQHMLSACAGQLIYNNGKFSLFVGKERTASGTITDDNLLAPIQITTKASGQDLANGVKATYVRPTDRYIAAEITPYKDSTYLSADTPSGEQSANYENFIDVTFPYTQSTFTAQRLARIALDYQRQDQTLQVIVPIEFMTHQVGDIVNFTNTRLGYDGKDFEIVAMDFEFMADDYLALRLNLKEYSATVFNNISYVADPTLPSPPSAGDNTVATPTGLTLTEASKNTTAKEIYVRAVWTNANDDKIDWTEVAYKKSTDTEFDAAIVGYPRKSFSFRAESATTYNIKVRHGSNNGVHGDYTGVVNITTSADVGTFTTGTIAGITVESDKLYEGTGTFNNSNTGFYLDNTGQFSLKDKLSFNGTTLNISGNLTVENTITADKIVLDGQALNTLMSSTGAGATTIDELTVSNDAFLQGGFQISASHDGIFLDNAKAKFGTGSDLQIYHDGSASYIDDTGTGQLILNTNGSQIALKFGSENMAIFGANGAVKLYHDSSKKFETNASGIEVIGSATFDNSISIEHSSGFGSIEVGGSSGAFIDLKNPMSDDYDLRLKTTGTGGEIDVLNGELTIKRGSAARITTSASGIDITGSATISGDLTVSGTTTTINTTNLDVADKNITLNFGAGDTSSNADGAGITIQDAVDSTTDATLLWNASNDVFEFSHGLDFGDNDRIRLGTSQDLQIYHDGSDSYVEDTGTGHLTLKGQDVKIRNASGQLLAQFLEAGAVDIRHAGSAKLTTTSSGISVTGNIESTGTINVDTADSTLPNTYFSAERYNDSSGKLIFGVGEASPSGGTTGETFIGNHNRRLHLGSVFDGVNHAPNISIMHMMIDEDGDLYVSQNNTHTQWFQASTRNLTNIGTISAGVFTTNANTGTFSNSIGTFPLVTSTPYDYVAKFESTDATAQIILEDVNGNNNANRIGVTTHDMFFVVNNTEAIRIENDGKVGIGTSSPSDKVEVYANGADVALRIHEDAGTHTARLHLREGTQDTHIQNRANNGFEIRTENNISTSNTAALSIAGTGVASFGYDVQMGGTTVIDSSRNLTNIGTISSGAITTSGLLTVGSGAGAIKINESFITARSSDNANDINLIANINVFDADDVVIGSTSGQRFNDNIVFRTNGSQALRLDSSQNATFAGTISSGEITSSGSGDQDLIINSTNSAKARVLLQENGTTKIFIENKANSVSGQFGIYSASANKYALLIDTSGNTSLNGGTLTSGAITSSGLVTADELSVTNDSTFNGGLDINGDATFGDNNKAIFGAGSDLQIFHDGSDSIIHDNGTGNLKIRATNLRILNAAGTQNFISHNDGGDVKLYHAGNQKLATTSTGIDVTGTVDASADVTLDGKLSIEHDGSNTGDVLSLFSNRFDQTTMYGFGLASGTLYYKANTRHQFYNGSNYDNSSFAMELDDNRLRLAVPLSMGTTTVIDTSRNLTNIVNGTLTGTLDVSGNVTFFDETADAHHSLTLQKRFNKETAIKWARGSDVDAQIRVGDSENLFIDYNHANTGDSVIFRNNSSEVARIDNSGRLGIGTTAPTSRLTVKSSSTSSQDSAITVQGNANTNAIFKVGEKSADGGRLHMFDGGVEKIAFYTDGTANHISAGFLGLGTSSPTQPLTVKADNTSAKAISLISRDANDVAGLQFVKTNGNQNALIDVTGENLRFYTGTTERLRVDSSGRLGIGTSSPSQTLDVAGNIQATGSRLISAAFDSNHYMRLEGNSSGGVLKGADGGVVTTLVRSYGDSYFNSGGGNFGIGVSNPTVLLDILGTGEVWHRITTSSSNLNGIRLGSSNGTRQNVLYRDRSNDLVYLRSGIDNADIAIIAGGSTNEIMRFDGENSRVGIGDTSPLAKLEVAGSIKATNRSTGHTGEAGVTLSYNTSSNIALLETWQSKPLVIDTFNYQQFNIGNTLAMFIDGTNRNVGINTNSPDEKLDVEGNLRLESSSSNGTYLALRNSATNGRNFRIGSNFVSGAGELAIYDDTAGAERLRIDSSGTLTTPSGTDMNILSASGMTLGSTTSITRFFTNNNEVVRIDTSGSVGIATTSPSASYKLDVNGKIRSQQEILINTGSLFVNQEGEGIHILSPNGTEYKLTVSNAGALVITEV